MAKFSMPKLGPLNRPLRFMRRLLPEWNFITIHYAYFLFTCLLSAVIFWGSSTPPRSVSFTNSLFLTVSAMTLAGLNTVNLSELNTFQQFLLFLLIMLGSAIFVSAFVVQVRRRAFERKMENFKEEHGRLGLRGRSRSRSKSRIGQRSFTTSSGRTEVSGLNGSTMSNTHPYAEKSDGQTDGTDQERDLTPPARRGAPEMNEVDSDADATSPVTERAGITFDADTRFGPSSALGNFASPTARAHRRRHSFSMQGVGARSSAGLHSKLQQEPSAAPALEPTTTMSSLPPKTQGDISRYFHSTAGWIARNSGFHGLTETERAQLGGYEYRAVLLLSWLVPVYFVLWQLLGCLGCAAWIAHHAPDTALTNGLNPWWVGAFNAVSAFNNSGMSLLDANMVAFQRSYYLLITMSMLILAGNTAYPLFLRLIVWCMFKVAEQFARDKPEPNFWCEWQKTLQFLLDHPRRCYTNLFPSQHTWWLTLSVFTLNAVDWAAFEILNIGNTELTSGLALHYRIIDGLFQAFAVRSGGFYVVTISDLRISLQVLYVVMMYISVYPVVITMRNSNVYEERSLGIYAEDQEDSDDEKADEEKLGSERRKTDLSGPLLRRARTFKDALAATHGGGRESNGHFVRQQLRAQLAHDAWWIVLALFLIMIVEAHNFHTEPVIYSVFNFIFEIVSAYGCVGISVGVPYAAYSFCGAWHTLSKLILCAVMLRGRHRGLPVAIDKAVSLPSERHSAAEEEDGRIRMAKSVTMERGRDSESRARI